MTAYTDELLDDPETLEDMQRIEGESDEQWKARTQRSDEIGDDNFKSGKIEWYMRNVYMHRNIATESLELMEMMQMIK